MRIKTSISLTLCILFSVSCGYREHKGEAKTGTGTGSYLPSIATGAKAPALEIRDTALSVIKLSKQRGHFVVLDFWASFCPDCRAEFPAVKALYDKYSPKGIKFIGISFDDKEEDWKDCLKEEQFPFPQGSNLVKWKENPINEAYGIRWIPTLMLISPEGTVICTALTASDMDAAIEKTVHFR